MNLTNCPFCNNELKCLINMSYCKNENCRMYFELNFINYDLDYLIIDHTGSCKKYRFKNLKISKTNLKFDFKDQSYITELFTIEKYLKSNSIEEFMNEINIIVDEILLFG